MRKVIDCFTFYNEFKMLEFRLTELYDVVDYFIIVEATHTHSGNKKELYFMNNKDDYKKFLDKIIVIIVDDMPNTGDAWQNENHQRRAIDRGIKSLNLNEDDIILISDCDEVPDSRTLMIAKQKGLNTMYALEMDFYYYNLKCRFTHKWYRARMVPYSIYRLYSDPEELRSETSCYSIKYGGWHLSYFGNIQFIKNKIKNFAHQEYNKEDFLDENLIQSQIENGKCLFDDEDEFKIEKIEIENNKYLPINYKYLF